MIRLRTSSDINWDNVIGVAYRGERLTIDPRTGTGRF